FRHIKSFVSIPRGSALTDQSRSAVNTQLWSEYLATMTSAADATLVGGSAAALYPAHRTSFDHDHVVGDLHDRFDAVLEALESDPEWVTNRVRPGKIILGQLGDIEAGVR